LSSLLVDWEDRGYTASFSGTNCNANASGMVDSNGYSNIVTFTGSPATAEFIYLTGGSNAPFNVLVNNSYEYYVIFRIGQQATNIEVQYTKDNGSTWTTLVNDSSPVITNSLWVKHNQPFPGT